jgi:hypothetical protein
MLDDGIEHEVRVLRENGVETTESCQGGQGHTFPEPTIRFRGGYAAGFKALTIAFTHGLDAKALRRVWHITAEGKPVGPEWEMTFRTRLGGGPRFVAKRNGNGLVKCKWV